MDINTLLLLNLLLPLVAAAWAGFISNKNIRDTGVTLIAVALFVNIFLGILPEVLGDGIVPYSILTIAGDLNISFHFDSLGMIFALIASLLWIITNIYAVGYMRGNGEAHQNRFFLFFSLAIFGVMGVAMSGNLFTTFIFYEFITLCTYPLVTHSGTDGAKKAGRIYLGVLLTTSICFFLPAMIWVYYLAGTLDFTAGGILAQSDATPATIGILLAMFIYGIGKAALMPAHKWLPAAMVAPTPVSALLHAVAVVKAGVFVVIKIIVYIFGADYLSSIISANWWSGGWLPYLAGATILISSIIAMKQDNLKRRLAYSTISQLSYIIMAAAILTPKAIVAASFHIAAHAFGKITLFFAAGAIYTASKKTKISELGGVAKAMPVTMLAFSIAAISMIGLPPAAGFLTKIYIFDGAFDASLYFPIIVLLLSTLLNAAYFLPIIFIAYFGEKDKGAKEHGEAPIAIIIAISITAALTIGLFIFPDLFLTLANMVGR